MFETLLKTQISQCGVTNTFIFLKSCSKKICVSITKYESVFNYPSVNALAGLFNPYLTNGFSHYYHLGE